MAFQNVVPAILANPITLLTLASGLLSYVAGLVVYRLFFHPLAAFPGPKIAAATRLYELYHDLVRGGQYSFVIREMHARYGPIVRISPYELHIDDVEYYDELYTGPTNPREKWEPAVGFFGAPSSFFATVSSALHRKRRGPFEHMFAKRSVVKLSPLLEHHVGKLCRRLEEFRGTGKLVNMRYAFAALALDVMTDYAFAMPSGSLDDPEFLPQWPDGVDALNGMSYITCTFPWLIAQMQKMPLWMTRITCPPLVLITEWRNDLAKQINAIMKNPLDPKYSSADRPTIFHELLNSDELPAADRNFKHLEEEAQVIVGAGQITTAYHLTATSFYVMSNPDITRRLKKELESVMPDPHTFPPLAKLEELEYLSAIITEGHRLTHGVVHRLARISPKVPIQFQDWTIPAGHPVSMTSFFIHTSPELFPNPEVFDPTRFLGEGRRLKKYVLPYSKGTRACLGQNLAQAELAYAIAGVFRKFDLKPFESTNIDLKFKSDFFTPFPTPNVQAYVE